LNNGLPPLVKMVSQSDPSIPDHVPAYLIQKHFGILKDLPTSSTYTSLIWVYLEGKLDQRLSWSSEWDVQRFVKDVFEEIVKILGLINKVKYLNELGIFRMRPDIWLFYANSIPFGVIEVKKPESKIMENNRVHGQIYYYMKKLKYFFGQKWVFGITTTYEKWRIHWLDEATDSIAQSDTIAKQELTPVQIFPTIDIPQWNHILETEEGPEVTFLASPVRRDFYGSRIYERNDRTLPQVLMSVLLKMYHSPREQVPLLDKKRSYIAMNKTSWFWTLSVDIEELDFSKLPKVGAQNLLLLQDLGGGAHGRTWLTCSTTGKVCVIKFAQEDPPRNVFKYIDISPSPVKEVKK
jgi:hypothetical protein